MVVQPAWSPRRAADDHCVKLKVTGLEPATSYIYLFVYEQGGDALPLAPGLHQDRAGPRVATYRSGSPCFNCQDYTDRYYNTLAEALLDHPNDLDFVVHLGDYVYETAKKTATADDDLERWFTFTDADGSDPAHGGVEHPTLRGGKPRQLPAPLSDLPV